MKQLVLILLLLQCTIGFSKSITLLASQRPIEVFQKLKLFVGDWQGKTTSGRTIKVSYRIAANDSVLVETWTLAADRDSLTLYHMDGPNLMATHYCPLGNQPRLRLRSDNENQKFVFDFFDATNLPTLKTAHQHQFEIDFIGSDSFTRSETYLEDGKNNVDAITFSRIK